MGMHMPWPMCAGQRQLAGVSSLHQMDLEDPLQLSVLVTSIHLLSPPACLDF